MDGLPALELPPEQEAMTGSGGLPGAMSGSVRPALLRVADARTWRRAACCAALAGVLTLGLRGASSLPNLPIAHALAAAATASPTASPSPAAYPSPSPFVAVASPSASPSAGPSATVIPSAVPAPSQDYPTARVEFSDLMLDSATGSPRTFTFMSDGGGTVTADVVGTSSTVATLLCVAQDGGVPVCDTTAAPGYSGPVTTAHSQWTVTLIAIGQSAATVDVAFSWPCREASIRLTQGRFEGAPNPDSLRSLSATFTTRATGPLTFSAAWPPAVAAATVTLSDTTPEKPVTVGTKTYPAANSLWPAYTHSLATGRTYALNLYNTSSGTGQPLTATIAFP